MGEGIGVGSEWLDVLKPNDHAIARSLGDVKDPSRWKGADKSAFLFGGKNAVKSGVFTRLY